jgi:hypothetical protein
MMTRTWAWIVIIAFVAAFAVPAAAQQAPATTAPAKPAAPAAKEPAKTDAKMAAKPKSAAGTVKSASADSLVLVAGKDKKEMTFALDKDTKVTKGGKAATAADIAADDAATVSYVEHDGKMMAKSVAVKAKSTAAAKPKS